MNWEKRTFRGVEYTFDHLRPFTMVVGGLRVRVKPGAHVFCKESQQGDPQDLKFMDGNTERTFCPVRYGLSQTLGQTIIAASNGYVYEGKHRKFLLKQSLPAPQGIYLIAFELWRNKGPHWDVTMQLNSAHNRPHVAKARFVRFSDAVAAVANGNNVGWIKK
ncbi:hypothetical protein [Sphingomonas sp. MS122]|uniref:hypothetical protein n=1 Tax=Sphingomonas sp. MS122 TaxID=3412683 RepID=UPI003C2BAC24